MYALLVRATGLAVDLFYRRVHLGGAVPAEGAALLVANHPNGLVDPVVVARATERRVRLLAKEPLFRMPIVSLLVKGMGCLPVYRAKDGADPRANASTFAAVEESLVRGDCVALFPEGISHDLPRLQPLKTGAARMAIGARLRGARVRIVPIGLVYRDKDRFRSELATKIGAPIVVDGYGEDDARALTDVIDEALRALTLELDTWEDLPLLEAALAIRGAPADDAARNAALVQLSDAARAVRARDPAALDAVRVRVREWVRRLAKLGLRPEDVGVRYTAKGVAAFAARNVVALLVGLPVALVGAVAYAVPFWAAHAAFLIARPEPDTAATVKVLAAMIFFPPWQAALVAGLMLALGPAAGFAVGALLPLCGLYTRRFFDRRAEAKRDLEAFLRTFLRARLTKRLEAERDELRAAIDALTPSRGT
jgi:glycerol-3-phosphate O-acyltransferase / dihydroxyacetone phosphate acyltransferase